MLINVLQIEAMLQLHKWKIVSTGAKSSHIFKAYMSPLEKLQENKQKSDDHLYQRVINSGIHAVAVNVAVELLLKSVQTV